MSKHDSTMCERLPTGTEAKRSSRVLRTSDPWAEGTGLCAVPPAALAAVTGGRYSRSSGPDPAVLAGLQQLSESIVAVGQSMMQARQQSSAMLMQMVQQMMQGRTG